MNQHLHDTAQTAIFLWQGFMEVVGKGGFTTATEIDKAAYERHFGDQGLGQDGGASMMAVFADAIESDFTKRWANHSCPGVYHYEIIEPLGAWIAKHEKTLGELTTRRVLTQYNRMMAAWLVADKLGT